MSDRWRRLVLALGLMVLVTVGPGRIASAHAELETTSPANQAILSTSPSAVVITFSEAVDPIDPSIRIVDVDGDEVAAGGTNGDDSSTLRLGLDGTLADGSYVVAWQAVSADSHKVRGAFTFSVGEQTSTSIGSLDDLFTTGSSQTAVDGLLGVARVASYLGVAVLLGGLFVALCLAPTTSGSRRLALLLWGAAVTALVGTAVMIAAQSRLVGSSLLDWRSVTDTRSGRWWVVRLVVIALFCGLVRARTHLTGRVGRGVVASAGLGVLCVVAAGGHGISGRIIPLGYAMTVVHLVAMAVWVGGVAVLAAATARRDVWTLAGRFSPWAFVSVVVLSVSGLVNGWRQLGGIGDIVGSTYGRWLLIKVVLVAAVVVAAAFGRRAVRGHVLRRPSTPDAPVPLALSAAALDTDARPDRACGVDPVRHRRLRTAVVVELVGMGLVLAATSGLVSAAPPPLDGAGDVTASTIVGDRIAMVELEPATTGGTTMHVTISSPRGGFDRADEITVDAELESDGIGPIEFETFPASPNHVIAEDADFPVAGLWTVSVTARYGEFDQVVFDIDVPVGG